MNDKNKKIKKEKFTVGEFFGENGFLELKKKYFTILLSDSITSWERRFITDLDVVLTKYKEKTMLTLTKSNKIDEIYKKAKRRR